MTQKKLITIGAIVAVVLIAIPVILLVVNQTKQSQIIEDEQAYVGEDYVDPVSGETLTKSDRQHDGADKLIAMVGFANLMDLGLGIDQYTQLEDKILLLNDQLDIEIEQASMYKDSAEKTYRDEGESRIWVINFDMQLNEKDDYAASIEYNSLTTMTLKVYTKDRSKLLYTL